MDTEKILKEIGEIYSPLSIDCQQALMDHSKIITFKKGEIVIREGQFAKKAYLILEGCARAYYLKDGKDISDWFTFEGIPIKKVTILHFPQLIKKEQKNQVRR